MDNEKVGNLEDLILISKFFLSSTFEDYIERKSKSEKKKREMKKKGLVEYISLHKLKPESRIIKRVFIIKC